MSPPAVYVIACGAGPTADLASFLRLARSAGWTVCVTATPQGAEFCNHAKTTAAPSQSQASNRKAGPACFIVGGGLRIEKRSGSVDGPLLPGATFSVVCTPTASEPPMNATD